MGERSFKRDREEKFHDNHATYPWSNQYNRNRKRCIIYNSVGCFLTKGVELGGHILEPKYILPSACHDTILMNGCIKPTEIKHLLWSSQREHYSVICQSRKLLFIIHLSRGHAFVKNFTQRVICISDSLNEKHCRS